MELFVEQDGKILLSPELKQFPEYRKIIERDKDRFKRTANQEFLYLYFMYSFKSPYVHNVDEESRPKKVAQDLKLDKNFKPDADLIYASVRYREHQRTASTETLQTVMEGLFTSNKVIGFLRSQINEAMKDPVSLAQNPAGVVVIVEQLQQLLKLSVDVPKMITTIETLENKVKKEQANTTVKLKGGGDKGSYEE